MRFPLKLLAAAAALVLLPAASAAAQAPAATITIDDGRAGIEGLEGHGWTTVTVQAAKPTDFAVVALRAGADTTGFANAVGKLAPAGIGRWGAWLMAGSARPGAPYTSTVNLTPGQYAIVTFGEKTTDWVGGFGVRDVPTGAPAPEAGAQIELRDFRFVAPKTVDAAAGIAVVNRGRQLHEAVIAKVKGPVGRAVRLARHGRFQKIRFAGMPQQAVGLVSPQTTNVVTPRLAPGRYLLVCAYGDRGSRNRPHSVLGMAQAITIR